MNLSEKITSLRKQNGLSQEDLAEKLPEVIQAVQECPLLCGYCYTQLTDIENEKNGLLTYDREPKIPLETIRAIIQGK